MEHISDVVSLLGRARRKFIEVFVCFKEFIDRLLNVGFNHQIALAAYENDGTFKISVLNFNEPLLLDAGDRARVDSGDA